MAIRVTRRKALLAATGVTTETVQLSDKMAITVPVKEAMVDALAIQ